MIRDFFLTSAPVYQAKELARAFREIRETAPEHLVPYLNKIESYIGGPVNVSDVYIKAQLASTSRVSKARGDKPSTVLDALVELLSTSLLFGSELAKHHSLHKISRDSEEPRPSSPQKSFLVVTG